MIKPLLVQVNESGIKDLLQIFRCILLEVSCECVKKDWYLCNSKTFLT